MVESISSSPFQFQPTHIDVSTVYSHLPTVFDGLSFYFSCSAITSKNIKFETKSGDYWFQVWSPNAKTMDFYPGYTKHLPSAFEIKEPSFPDGRLGPHDWSLHPQHYNNERPWIHFCRRTPLGVKDWRSHDAELVPLTQIWIASRSRPGLGILHPDYLLALRRRALSLLESVTDYTCPVSPQDKALRRVLKCRPSFPSRDVIAALDADDPYLYWHECVNGYTAIQRGYARWKHGFV
ncbi:hypothetical protein BDQ17DRAFT_844356 [Cyathus striatus]|nr:hypothetical protein BDQ17DRAFT_844356 [Cyathus striatus]